jgi:hypothetical protein
MVNEGWWKSFFQNISLRLELFVLSAFRDKVKARVDMTHRPRIVVGVALVGTSHQSLLFSFDGRHGAAQAIKSVFVVGDEAKYAE